MVIRNSKVCCGKALRKHRPLNVIISYFENANEQTEQLYLKLMNFNLHSKVFHYDASDAISKCSSSGDPHIVTFDGVYFSTYSTGTYVYSRTLDGLPLEVRNLNASKNAEFVFIACRL